MAVRLHSIDDLFPTMPFVYPLLRFIESVFAISVKHYTAQAPCFIVHSDTLVISNLRTSSFRSLLCLVSLTNGCMYLVVCLKNHNAYVIQLGLE